MRFPFFFKPAPIRAMPDVRAAATSVPTRGNKVSTGFVRGCEVENKLAASTDALVQRRLLAMMPVPPQRPPGPREIALSRMFVGVPETPTHLPRRRAAQPSQQAKRNSAVQPDARNVTMDDVNRARVREGLARRALIKATANNSTAKRLRAEHLLRFACRERLLMERKYLQSIRTVNHQGRQGRVEK